VPLTGLGNRERDIAALATYDRLEFAAVQAHVVHLVSVGIADEHPGGLVHKCLAMENHVRCRVPKDRIQAPLVLGETLDKPAWAHDVPPVERDGWVEHIVHLEVKVRMLGSRRCH
jgi:hypothetical protein